MHREANKIKTEPELIPSVAGLCESLRFPLAGGLSDLARAAAALTIIAHLVREQVIVLLKEDLTARACTAGPHRR